jgi:AraC-like DNA-binding protein
VTACVLRVYEQTIGSVAPLLLEQGYASPAGMTIEEFVRALPAPDLARLSTRAVQHLAAHDSRCSGRAPLRTSDWRVILYSLSGARTLREALQRCSECFEAIDWRCGRMTLRTCGDRAELELDSLRPASSPAGCLIDLMGVAQIHDLLGWLIARPLPLHHAWLDHDERVFSRLELPPLPISLRLAAGWTGFDFAAAYLDHPVVRTADELATRPPLILLFNAGHSDAAGARLSDQVRRIAFKSLWEKQRLPAFEDIVAATGGSAATLRRRLVREGTSYRQVKDSCRREMAMDMLRRSSLSVEEIAARLDFCDSDAFRRAFREWLGIPPSRYRREFEAEAAA